MGKTENGAIWLNAELLSPYDYWQFWRNTNDSDVKRFLKYFTEINTEEIDKLFIKEKNINNLKILLANETTKILHGEQKAKESEETAEETFSGKGIGKKLPEILIDKFQLKEGISIIQLMYEKKIISSKSEIRRAINEKGIKINDKLVESIKEIVTIKDFEENSCLKISHGKKKHFVIRVK